MNNIKELSACEKELYLVIDNLPNMIAYVDSTKRYRIINRAYHDYFGVNENEIIGKHASEILGNEFYQMVSKYIDVALSGKSISWETHNCDADNNEQILSVKLVPYSDSKGNRNGYLIVVEDITTQKQFQVQLESMNSFLEEMVDRRTKQLQKELTRRKILEKSLRELADHDSLTGLLNRRSFSQRVEYEIGRSHRYNSELSYMIIDIDKFKKINDTYGHMAGDVVLKSFSRKILGILRESDFIGRIGGEEFAIALPGTNVASANEMGERIRREIAEHNINYKNISINITVSIGISKFLPGEEDIEGVFCRADSALYTAKHSGRNKVCVAA